MTHERIHPAPDLKNVHFPKYQRAIAQMVREGLYDLETGWRPESRERIRELMAEGTTSEQTLQETPHANAEPQMTRKDHPALWTRTQRTTKRNPPGL